MKDGIKIVTIGGGSSYTPELMEGFIKRYHELPIKEIWLVDIEEGKEKLNIIGELTKRMWEATPYDVQIHVTLNRKEALKNADFVTTQFRVGLLDARIKDERIPSLHGMIGQETNGAGGIFKALRTIPVMKEIVEDMKVECPSAWLINFTNPSGIITEAIIKHFHWEKCIGLCNVPTIAIMSEPKVLNKEQANVTTQFAGLNHFHWHKVHDEFGNEITNELINHINDKNGGTPKNIHQEEFSLNLLHHTNLLPCGYHRYYYMHEEMLKHSLEEFHKDGTRAEQMKKVEKELFEIYQNPELHEKPEQLSKRGGAYYSDAACECISAIYNNKQQTMVVSTENKGALPCLADDSIIEITSLITSSGAIPLAWGNMPPLQKGYIQLMKAMEECVIHASLNGDYESILEAFLLNPLIHNGKEANVVLHELMVAHEKHLPQFHDKIQELKLQGFSCEDGVVKKLMKQD